MKWPDSRGNEHLVEVGPFVDNTDKQDDAIYIYIYIYTVRYDPNGPNPVALDLERNVTAFADLDVN